MNHLVIKALDPSKPMTPGNVQLLLDEKEIYASCVEFRIEVGCLPTAKIELVATAEIDGIALVETMPRIAGCPYCKGYGKIEYHFIKDEIAETHNCPKCDGTGQEPKRDGKLVD